MVKIFKNKNIILDIDKFTSFCDQILIESHLKCKIPDYITQDHLNEIKAFDRQIKYDSFGSLKLNHLKMNGGNLIGFIIDFFKFN